MSTHNILFDVQHPRYPAQVGAPSPNGSMGQMSFTRLAKLLRQGGELLPNESLRYIEIDPEFGVKFYMELK